MSKPNFVRKPMSKILDEPIRKLADKPKLYPISDDEVDSEAEADYRDLVDIFRSKVDGG